MEALACRRARSLRLAGVWHGKAMAIGVKQILDYDDYAAIPPDGKRWELREGDVHVTPAPSPRHQWSSKKLQRRKRPVNRTFPWGA